MLVSNQSRVVRKVFSLSLLSSNFQGNDGYLYLLIDRHLYLEKGANKIWQWVIFYNQPRMMMAEGEFDCCCEFFVEV